MDHTNLQCRIPINLGQWVFFDNCAHIIYFVVAPNCSLILQRFNNLPHLYLFVKFAVLCIDYVSFIQHLCLLLAYCCFILILCIMLASNSSLADNSNLGGWSRYLVDRLWRRCEIIWYCLWFFLVPIRAYFLTLRCYIPVFGDITKGLAVWIFLSSFRSINGRRCFIFSWLLVNDDGDVARALNARRTVIIRLAILALDFRFGLS